MLKFPPLKPLKIPKPDFNVNRKFHSQGYGQTINQQIKRGETPTQSNPRADVEAYKTFSLLYTSGSGLAPNTSAHYKDINTNTAMPYTMPAGMSGDFRAYFFAGTTNTALTLSLDSTIVYYLPVGAYTPILQYEQIVWLTTLLTDPTYANQHVWDAQLTNLDSANTLYGSFQITLVFTAPPGQALPPVPP